MHTGVLRFIKLVRTREWRACQQQRQGRYHTLSFHSITVVQSHGAWRDYWCAATPVSVIKIKTKTKIVELTLVPQVYCPVQVYVTWSSKSGKAKADRRWLQRVAQESRHCT